MRPANLAGDARAFISIGEVLPMFYFQIESTYNAHQYVGLKTESVANTIGVPQTAL